MAKNDNGWDYTKSGRKSREPEKGSLAFNLLYALIWVIVALMLVLVVLYVANPPEVSTPPSPALNPEASENLAPPEDLNSEDNALNSEETEDDYSPYMTPEMTLAPDADGDLLYNVEAPDDFSNVSALTNVNRIDPETLPPYDKLFFNDTLFIGDSIFTGLSGYDFIPAGNVFAEMGMAPASALSHSINDETALDKAKNFTRAVIMLGTNSLGYGDYDLIAGDMKTLVSRLNSETALSEIAVLTVPPVASRSDYAVNIDMINEYNAKLYEVLADENVLIIDACDILKDSSGYIGKEYVQPDGMHLMQDAYKVILALVQSELSN